MKISRGGLGRAYGEYLKPKTIVLGGDAARLTSEGRRSWRWRKGLQDAGVDVLDIGMSGTEEIYSPSTRRVGRRY